MRKICIITGTRAEWGLLSRLAGLIQADGELQLQIVATNMHLMERYGYTYREIEQDGFRIDHKVDMEASGDDAGAVVRSMGSALSGFAAAYQTLRPDMLVVLGDRYEILAAVTAALIFKIPVAHLHGGEITEGAYDDSIRHAITKMSHLHFTSTEAYRQRVIRMGEEPQRVFNVGAVGVDNIKQIPLWSKEETQKSLGGFRLDRKTILVTYHPVTLEGTLSSEQQIDTLLAALDAVPELRVIFTMPNSDTDNRIIAHKIQTWCADAGNRDRAVWFASLGLKRYLSTLQYIGGVVGNSSSGIVEVPSFGIPTIDIGDRQKGRLAAESVVHVAVKKEAIIEKLGLLLSDKLPAGGVNPYDKADSARAIYNLLKSTPVNLQKHFYDPPRHDF